MTGCHQQEEKEKEKENIAESQKTTSGNLIIVPFLYH